MNSRILPRGGESAIPVCLVALVAIVGWLFVASSATAADPSGSISGTLTAEGSHLPLEGVEVCAFAWHEEEVPSFCATSDENGDYSLKALTAGEYTVEFNPGVNGLNYIGEAWNDQPSWPDGDILEVGSDPLTGIDAEFAVGGEIHGRVSDAGTGAPLSGVTVCVFPIDTFRVWSCGTSAADGHYAVVGNEGGRHEVAFFFESEGSEYLGQYYNGKSQMFEGDPVQVTVGAVVSNIDAALAREARIAGAVRDAVTRAAVPDVEVCAREPDTAVWVECVRTGAAGEYSIDGLPPGTYKVSFNPRPFTEGLSGEKVPGLYPPQYFDSALSWADADPLSLGSGTRLSGIDAALITWSASVASPSVPLGPVPPLRCRKGFKGRTIKGKLRCVRPLRCRKSFRKRKVKGKLRCRKVRRPAR